MGEIHSKSAPPGAHNGSCYDLEVVEASRLSEASQRGQAEIVAKLLRRGKKPTKTDERGDTPLHKAAAFGHAEVVSLLLKKHAELATIENAEGLTPFHLAAQFGKLECAKLILDAVPKLVNAPFPKNPVNFDYSLIDRSGKIIWTINNFSRIEEKKIYSDVFQIGGYKWRLVAYPRGSKADDNLSLFLEVANHESLPAGWSHQVSFDLGVMNHLIGEYKAVRHVPVHRFSKGHTDLGFPHMIKKSALYNRKFGYIHNDRMQISCTMRGIEPTTYSLDDCSGSYTCKLNGINKTKEQRMSTNIFYIAGVPWAISVYPKGKLVSQSLSVYLRIIPPSVRPHYCSTWNSSNHLHPDHIPEPQPSSWSSTTLSFLKLDTSNTISPTNSNNSNSNTGNLSTMSLNLNSSIPSSAASNNLGNLQDPNLNPSSPHNSSLPSSSASNSQNQLYSSTFSSAQGSSLHPISSDPSESKSSHNDWYYVTNFRISLVNQTDGSKFTRSVKLKVFKVGAEDWGFPLFMKLSSLHNGSSDFVLDDSIVLEVSIDIVDACRPISSLPSRHLITTLPSTMVVLKPSSTHINYQGATIVSLATGSVAFSTQLKKPFGLKGMKPGTLWKLNMPIKKLNFTPLHWAVYLGSLESVMELLARGADVDLVDANQRTSLDWACYLGHFDIVKLLINHNASIKTRDTELARPVHKAALMGSVDVIQLILNHFSQVDCDISKHDKRSKNSNPEYNIMTVSPNMDDPTEVASGYNSSGTIPSPRSGGVSGNLTISSHPLSPKSPKTGPSSAVFPSQNPPSQHLASASSTNLMSSSEAFPDHLSSSQHDNHDSGASEEAVSSIKTEAGGLLSQQQSNLFYEHEHSSSSTYQHQSIFKSSTNELRLSSQLLTVVDESYAPVPNPTPPPSITVTLSMFSPLQLSLKCHRSALTELLVEDHHSNLNCIDSFGRSPLHFASSWGDVNLLELFLGKCNPNMVNLKDKDGYTPLHKAVNRGYFDCVQILLNAGADIGIRSKTGYTPFHYAVFMNEFECAKMVLEFDRRRGTAPVPLRPNLEDARRGSDVAESDTPLLTEKKKLSVSISDTIQLHRSDLMPQGPTTQPISPLASPTHSNDRPPLGILHYPPGSEGSAIRAQKLIKKSTGFANSDEEPFEVREAEIVDAAGGDHPATNTASSSSTKSTARRSVGFTSENAVVRIKSSKSDHDLEPANLVDVLDDIPANSSLLQSKESKIATRESESDTEDGSGRDQDEAPSRNEDSPQHSEGSNPPSNGTINTNNSNINQQSLFPSASTAVASTQVPNIAAGNMEDDGALSADSDDDIERKAKKSSAKVVRARSNTTGQYRGRKLRERIGRFLSDDDEDLSIANASYFDDFREDGEDKPEESSESTSQLSEFVRQRYVAEVPPSLKETRGRPLHRSVISSSKNGSSISINANESTSYPSTTKMTKVPSGGSSGQMNSAASSALSQSPSNGNVNASNNIGSYNQLNLDESGDYDEERKSVNFRKTQFSKSRSKSSDTFRTDNTIGLPHATPLTANPNSPSTNPVGNTSNTSPTPDSQKRPSRLSGLVQSTMRALSKVSSEQSSSTTTSYNNGSSSSNPATGSHSLTFAAESENIIIKRSKVRRSSSSSSLDAQTIVKAHQPSKSKDQPSAAVLSPVPSPLPSPTMVPKGVKQGLQRSAENPIVTQSTKQGDDTPRRTRKSRSPPPSGRRPKSGSISTTERDLAFISPRPVSPRSSSNSSIITNIICNNPASNASNESSNSNTTANQPGTTTIATCTSPPLHLYANLPNTSSSGHHHHTKTPSGDGSSHQVDSSSKTSESKSKNESAISSSINVNHPPSASHASSVGAPHSESSKSPPNSIGSIPASSASTTTTAASPITSTNLSSEKDSKKKRSRSKSAGKSDNQKISTSSSGVGSLHLSKVSIAGNDSSSNALNQSHGSIHPNWSSVIGGFGGSPNNIVSPRSQTPYPPYYTYQEILSMTDKNGWTPLHTAVKQGNQAMVKYLLEKGASINTPGHSCSVLDLAIQNQDAVLAMILLEKGAIIQEIGPSLFQFVNHKLIPVRNLEAFPPIPPSTFVSDMRSLVNNSMFYDVIFVIEGTKVYGWRGLLATRCEVFRAMFTTQLRESTEVTIEISDISYSTFMRVIEFIYTDSVSSEKMNLEEALQLLAAANRYMLDRLKKLVERWLISQLSNENIAAIFHAADLYQAHKLCSSCIVFVAAHLDEIEDIHEILNTSFKNALLDCLKYPNLRELN